MLRHSCASSRQRSLPCRRWGQRAELEKIIQRKVLANGLEVIVVENHGVPLATIEIDVKNGSFTQSPEYEGLAHMYEHMFFKANSKYPEPNQFLDARRSWARCSTERPRKSASTTT